MDAKLTKLVKFFGNKVDVHSQVNTEYSRGCHTAYGIAKMMLEQIVFDILDKQLTEDDECCL